jgi:GntR family transcriptional regulator, carbon starvation induced regulator
LLYRLLHELYISLAVVDNNPRAMDHAVAAPSDSRSLTSLAYERLREDILLGRLAPSERLRIQALSERYEIGATAIREALSRLTTDGLVQAEDQRGFAVTPVSRDELLDLTETRIQVEQMALRMAVSHGDVEWESRVLSSAHRLSRAETQPWSAETLAAWAAAHRQFHESLVAGCGSPWLGRLCRLLYDQSERYRALSVRPARKRKRDVGREHRELTEAALARDAEALCTLIEAHLRRTSDLILESGLSDGARPGAAAPGRRNRGG